jgi:hypothetical protein
VERHLRVFDLQGLGGEFLYFRSKRHTGEVLISQAAGIK